MSISPLSFTDQAHREPLALLSMQTPTAVRPSMAKAGVAAVVIRIAAKVVTARRIVI
jgi:hypothetical protein